MLLSTFKRFFFTFYGILHLTTCPHTSQQNQVAERKLSHVLNVARTLLVHMYVPKTFWVEAILCASFNKYNALFCTL